MTSFFTLLYPQEINANGIFGNDPFYGNAASRMSHPVFSFFVWVVILSIFCEESYSPVYSSDVGSKILRLTQDDK